MPHQEELEQLKADVSMYLSHLNTALVKGLAIYAFGMALTRHSGQCFVAEAMSQLLGVKRDAMRQRLRELTYESAVKRGDKRRELDVSTCFTPLMRWVLSKFDAERREIVLALDATYLRDRFTILAVSVVVVGCAIPVAWRIQRGGEKGQWNPIWRHLLGYVQAAIPADWTVCVLADSGLYSKSLFQHLRADLHWHPHMRIGTGGLCREANGRWLPLAQLASRGMQPMGCQRICFKGDPLACTLLVEWDATCDQPCLVITDLPLLQARHSTYHLRFWIEGGFKALKRGGLHWEHTKMTDPQRAERLWLVMSIALLYLVTRGVAADQWLCPVTYTRSHRQTLSSLQHGWITWIVHLITHQPLVAARNFAYDPLSLPIPAYTYP